MKHRITADVSCYQPSKLYEEQIITTTWMLFKHYKIKLLKKIEVILINFTIPSFVSNAQGIDNRCSRGKYFSANFVGKIYLKNLSKY